MGSHRMDSHGTGVLGVGVIGLGVGEQLAGAFDRHPDCRLVALCDVDADRLAEVGARFPGARRHADADALFADPEIGAVAVASYDEAHARDILRALESGRHVFSEKPLCTTQADAAAIAAALSAAPHLRLSTNTVLRASPRFAALRAGIGAGRLGRPYYVEADYNYGRLHKLTEGWRGRSPGYSVMLGGGIHMIDLVLWLVGSDVVEVTAYGNRIASAAAGGAFQGSDLSVALLRFSCGAVGKVAANFGCVAPHFHRLVIYATEATWENGLPHARLTTSRDPGAAPAEITDAYPGMGKGDLVPSFVDAVLGRGPALVSEREALAALAVCFAVDRSLESGRPEAVHHF